MLTDIQDSLVLLRHDDNVLGQEFENGLVRLSIVGTGPVMLQVVTKLLRLVFGRFTVMMAKERHCRSCTVVNNITLVSTMVEIIR